MSPTILAELLRVRRNLTSHVVEVWGDTVLDYAKEQEHYARGCYRITGRLTPMKMLIAELPERRWYEECEREEAAKAAAGGREVCPKCGKRTMLSSDVYTLGYAGHPGAEVSVYRKCESCGHGEL